MEFVKSSKLQINVKTEYFYYMLYMKLAHFTYL